MASHRWAAAAALCAILGAALGGCAPERRASPLPLTGFQMTSSATGWSWGYSPGGRLQLLRTTDGGRTWSATSAPLVRRSAENPADLALSFLDARLGWVAWVTPPHAGRSELAVARTVNGGRSWTLTKAALPGVFAGGSVAALDFTDASHGWLAALSPGREGWQAKTVFRSTDGGTGWSLVSADTGRISDPAATPAALPQEGGVRMRFVSDEVGWAGLDHFMTPGSEVNLFATADAGARWSRSTLPVPRALTADGSSAGAPAFAGPRGVLLVMFSQRGGAQPTVASYATQDRGATWTLRSTIPGALGPQSFFDARVGLAAIGGRLRWTDDAGRSWRPIRVPSPGAHPAAVQVVSTRSAWILLRAAGGHASSTLWHTADGGRTWQRVPSGAFRY